MASKKKTTEPAPTKEPGPLPPYEPNPMFSKFLAESVEAFKKENEMYDAMPKVHDISKGEYIEEVDPAEYDRDPGDPRPTKAAAE